MSSLFVSRRVRRAGLLLLLAVVAPVVTAADASKLNLSGLDNQHRYDRFIVTYRDNTPAVAVSALSAAFSRSGLNLRSAAPVRYLRRLASGASVMKLPRRLDASEASQLMQALAADPAVLHVAPDLLRQPVRDLTMAPRSVTQPDDPDYGRWQWHFFDPVGGVRAPQAWAMSRGAGMVVAVLDTGITVHPDLDTSLAASGYDFISDPLVSGRADEGRVAGGWDTGNWTDGAPYEGQCGDGEPSNWHGTHVAGTIAELTDNGIGVAGLANQAKVLPVRVLGHCGGYDSDIADAVTWAAGGHVEGVPDNPHPAQVINMSLGGGGFCSAEDALGAAILGAQARGTTVVVAAGNDGSDARYVSPANCPGVIAVAASGITGKRAFYSNYGPNLTLAAPGGGVFADDAASGNQVDQGFVWSAINAGSHEPTTPGYVGMAGTSQATPHVAATVAMVQSSLQARGMPALSPARMAELLKASARPFPQAVDQPIGAGLLDAAAALEMTGLSSQPELPGTRQLVNGKPLAAQQAAAGAALLYRLEVPFGARNLSLRTVGGSGSLVVYLKRGAMPAVDGADADYSASRAGTSQVLSLPANAPSGVYYARVVAIKAVSNLTVLGAYTAPAP